MASKSFKRSVPTLETRRRSRCLLFEGEEWAYEELYDRAGERDAPRSGLQGARPVSLTQGLFFFSTKAGVNRAVNTTCAGEELRHIFDDTEVRLCLMTGSGDQTRAP